MNYGVPTLVLPPYPCPSPVGLAARSIVFFASSTLGGVGRLRLAPRKHVDYGVPCPVPPSLLALGYPRGGI